MRWWSVARLVCAVGLVGCGGASTPAKPSTPGTCTKPPTILQVAWQPPRPGEKLHFEETTKYDLTTRDKVSNGQARFVTDEVVISVGHDAIEELEVNFVEGRYQPDLSKPLVQLAGTYRVRGNDKGESVFTKDEQAAGEEVVGALRAYERNDVGPPHWLLRILTDRTYEIGQETFLPHESIAGSGGMTLDARITLKSVAADRATFFLESRVWMSERPVFVSRGNVVMDTVHARLVSIDSAIEPDGPPEVLQKAGVSGHIADHQLFRYDVPSSSSAASLLDGCNQPRTLHIKRIDPRVGDQYSVDQEMRLDETIRNEKTSRAVRVRGGWTASTDERVAQVQTGLITAIEIKARKERLHAFTFGATESPEVSNDGDVIEIKPSGESTVITRNGAALETKGDLALVVALGGLMAEAWTTRIATDRTYQVGVEQYFSDELFENLAQKHSPARVTLASIDGDIATFKLDIKSVFDMGTKPFPVFLRGTLTFDIKHARPIAIHLAGDFDVRDGLTKEGEYVMSFQFRYPH